MGEQTRFSMSLLGVPYHIINISYTTLLLISDVLQVAPVSWKCFHAYAWFFFHIDNFFLNKDQRYTCKVLQHRQQLACIYLESNSCFIKNKSLKPITSSTNHCMDNLLSQNLLLQTDVKAEPCLQYLDKSVEAVWTFYKPKWKNMKAQISNGIAGKGRKYTGDQESLFIHVAQFSDSAETHCQLRLSNLFLSLNLIFHFLFYSLGTKSCFESGSPKGTCCFLIVSHFRSWPYFPCSSFSLLWISYSRKGNNLLKNLFIMSTVPHEHHPPFANVCFFVCFRNA